jgi:hypothetical protein
MRLTLSIAGGRSTGSWIVRLRPHVERRYGSLRRQRALEVNASSAAAARM